jgi:hypothetical protein
METPQSSTEPATPIAHQQVTTGVITQLIRWKARRMGLTTVPARAAPYAKALKPSQLTAPA